MKADSRPEVCLDCTRTRLCAKHRAEKEAQVQADMAAVKEKLEQAKALGVVFAAPPPPATSARLEKKVGPQLDLLMKYPGEWALVLRSDSSQGASNTAGSLRKKRLRPGRWEFRPARTSAGSNLFACYLGPEEPEQ